MISVGITLYFHPNCESKVNWAPGRMKIKLCYAWNLRQNTRTNTQLLGALHMKSRHHQRKLLHRVMKNRLPCKFAHMCECASVFSAPFFPPSCMRVLCYQCFSTCCAFYYFVICICMEIWIPCSQLLTPHQLFHNTKPHSSWSWIYICFLCDLSTTTDTYWASPERVSVCVLVVLWKKGQH